MKAYNYGKRQVLQDGKTVACTEIVTLDCPRR